MAERVESKAMNSEYCTGAFYKWPAVSFNFKLFSNHKLSWRVHYIHYVTSKTGVSSWNVHLQISFIVNWEVLCLHHFVFHLKRTINIHPVWFWARTPPLKLTHQRDSQKLYKFCHAGATTAARHGKGSSFWEDSLIILVTKDSYTHFWLL